MASPCCERAGKPVIHDYTPVGGSEKSIDNMDVYVTGSGTSAVIFIYDIFGLKFNQVKQVADRVAASAGVVVAVPDVFLGQPWPMEKMPPKPEDNLMGWITTAGSWDSVSKYLNATVDMLKAKGVTKFGVFGFCWGAYIAMTAGKEATYSFVGGAHPSLLGKAKEISEPVQVPVILISCKEDPMEEVKEVTDKKPFASKCFYQRFDDQVHGFLGARGNYKDATVASRAGEAVELIANFAKSRF